MFEVNKNSRMTPLTSLRFFYCKLFIANFTLFSSVSIIDFEQVNISWKY